MDFDKIKNVAVVGISGNKERASYQVAKYLQEEGFRIIPVNPTLEEVLGERCFPEVAAIPQEISVDVVDIFRRPDAVPSIVEQAISRKAAFIWMQEGVIHEEAAEKARRAGVEVIMDKCIKKEHIKLKGGRQVGI